MQFAYTLDTLYERTYVLFIKIIEYKIFQDIALGYQDTYIPPIIVYFIVNHL